MKYFTQCGGDLDEVDQDRAPVPPRRCGNFRSGAMRSNAKKAVATTIMASVGRARSNMGSNMGSIR